MFWLILEHKFEACHVRIYQSFTKNAMVKKFSNQMSSFVTYIHHIYLVNVYIVLYLLYVRLSQNGLVKFMMFFNKKKLFYFVYIQPK